MKFPISWLKEIIPTEQDAESIEAKLNQIGFEVEGREEKKGEVVLEIGITPNLGFASNILGLAKELSAITGEAIVYPDIHFTEKEIPALEIILEKKEEVPAYAALVADARVTPSSPKMANRLELSKIRSKNSLVDITNFVMLEMGQPLHVFDYDKIEGKTLIIRRAKAGESIITLDDIELFLTEETLVIADKKGPLAIAGIMGGRRAEINENTKKIVIESAYFDPKSIRKSSKRLGIKTEASWRFERGCDPNALVTALKRAATLIQQGQKEAKIYKIIEKKESSFPLKQISCRLRRVNQVLGTNLALNEVETIFARLGFSIKERNLDTLTVIIPSNRYDIVEEIDLIEEVARFYGYDNIYHKNREVTYQGSSLPHHPFYPYLKKVSNILLKNGMQEVKTCDLISMDEAHFVSPKIFQSRSLVKILNPTSLAHSVMRPSLFPNMLGVVLENFHHALFSFQAFEVGKIHFKIGEKFVEPTSLALVMTGTKEAPQWQEKTKEIDFFDIKGVVENLQEGLKLPLFTFLPSEFPNFHPSRQAKILLSDNREIGMVGEIHPHFLKTARIEKPVFFAEVNLDDLFSHIKKEITMTPLPLFPSSVRDLTLSVKKKTLFKDLMDEIYKVPVKILQEVLLLDVYESDKLGSEIKNITLRFVYRDLTKTISHDEVEREHEKIVNRIKGNL